MKTIKTFVFLLFMMVAISACVPGDQTKKDSNDENPAETVFPIVTQEIEQKSVTRTLDYAANLIASKEIYFAPASPGRIEKIHVEIGDRVKKGQLLVETDRTQLVQAQTQLASARDNFNRIDTLYQLGSIAEQQYEQSKTQLEMAESNVKFLLENTTLQSPINGIVTGKYYENGELYSGAPNTQAGKAAIITLMQINPLKAVVSISQSFFPDVKNGQKVIITSDIFPGRSFDGNVTKIYPTIDAMTRTFKTEILVDNPKELLRPGMYANISLALENDTALLVPAISIMKQSGTNNRFIFLNDQGVARKVEVQPGKRYNNLVEIIADKPLAGASLIVDGQARLLDGSKVKITTGSVNN